MADLAPLEIQALARIIDELDYYQIMHLERQASPKDLKTAYHSSSRTFHPDANRHLDAELRSDCNRISKRLTEAYCVLRDPRRRKAYDQRLDDGGERRMQLAEAKAAHARQDAEQRQGRTPQGRQFCSKAMQDLRRDDLDAAVRNLQMALTFEPGNPMFEQRLEEVRKKRTERERGRS